MTIAKSLNQMKNEITHKKQEQTNHRIIQGVQISKIKRRQRKFLCLKFKVDNYAQVLDDKLWLILLVSNLFFLAEVGFGGGSSNGGGI